MKPLNHDDPGCNYSTSNCVIWQGPNLPCINLCKGDTVSTVIYNMAVELCEVMDMLKVEAYDLSCFNLTSCKPEDFQELIQFLIKRICCLESCTGCKPDCNDKCPTPEAPTLPGNSGSGCPDCTVPIAPCFYYTNQFGDQVTSMQLTDYVNAIGNKLCDTIKLINTQQTAIVDVAERVTQLEQAPPPAYIPPTVTPSCVLPPVPTEMDVLLSALETQFCQLRGATGTPDELYTNIANQCAGLNSENVLNGSGGTMAAIPGWTSTVSNLAQAFGNMWLTVCDMRQAIKNIQLNCCPAGCDGISLTMTAILDGNLLTVYINGTIPVGFTQCLPTGTPLKVTDSSGGYAQFNVDIIAYLNNPTGYTINLDSTPINYALNLNLNMTSCLTNSSTGATCESCLDFTIVNSAICPDLTFDITEGNVAYTFTSGVGNYNYSVQLWDNTGGILIDTQVHVIEGVQVVAGAFAGLDPNTNYKIRVSIIPTACPECTPTVCPFATVTTPALPCLEPTDVTAEITYP
jgi:hypothetical protein